MNTDTRDEIARRSIPETAPYHPDGENCDACSEVQDLCRYHQGWVHGQQDADKTSTDTRLADAAAQLESARTWAVTFENECTRLNAELKQLRRQLTAIEAMQVPAQVRARNITLALGYETALRDMHAALGQAERGEAA